MTAIDLIIDFYRGSDRQGPGSQAEAKRALDMISLSGKDLKIADIGCGTGGQTITLAQELNGHITAVDLFPEFLYDLSKRAALNGLEDRISVLESSMDALPFKQNTFDLIWSEGAIYNIGFEKGINIWREFLKPGGYLAVSEITWITNSRPREIHDFWVDEYAEIDVASRKINQLESNGYSLVGYFYLKPESWIDNYYEPMESRFPIFLERHSYSDAALKLVKEHQKEIEYYHRYKDYYSYGFYIARKNS